MRINKSWPVLVLGVVSFLFLNGCHLLDGGMNTVEPPNLSSEYDTPPKASILEDLSPIRPRDMMYDERRESQNRD